MLFIAFRPAHKQKEARLAQRNLRLHTRQSCVSHAGHFFSYQAIIILFSQHQVREIQHTREAMWPSKSHSQSYSSTTTQGTCLPIHDNTLTSSTRIMAIPPSKSFQTTRISSPPYLSGIPSHTGLSPPPFHCIPSKRAKQIVPPLLILPRHPPGKSKTTPSMHQEKTVDTSCIPPDCLPQR